MTKRQYVAKNIREGLKAVDAIELIKAADFNTSKIIITVDSFNHGRDTCGNGTAHYRCEIKLYNSEGYYYCKGMFPLQVVASGARREQVGYSGKNESALYALRQLGYELDTTGLRNYDYEGYAEYQVLNNIQ